MRMKKRGRIERKEERHENEDEKRKGKYKKVVESEREGKESM